MKIEDVIDLLYDDPDELLEVTEIEWDEGNISEVTIQEVD